jgi:hypothetical protein
LSFGAKGGGSQISKATFSNSGYVDKLNECDVTNVEETFRLQDLLMLLLQMMLTANFAKPEDLLNCSSCRLLPGRLKLKSDLILLDVSNLNIRSNS